MSMWKQHAIADFSTSQLLLFCMLVWETLLQRKRRTVRFTQIDLLLILRAYRAHPTVGLTYWTTWRLILPEQPRQLYGTGTSRQLKVECQSSQGSWCLLLSLVTKRSHNTQSHYQKDEMQSWQTCQTRKMRHQDRVEGGFTEDCI